jgi:alcohol dehydrogenase, propanol-preferring
MFAARMHAYKKPLVLEDVPRPPITPDQVLVRVEAAGMCRTDFQMVDGYFSESLSLPFPATPGHEIAGSIEEIGSGVPATANLAVGDQVVVVGGWGEGSCRHCRAGNEQICGHGAWPGFGPYGGYSEFVPVPAKYLIRVDRKYNLKSEELAPLTDAGLTPYRGIKKLRAAGVVGPDRLLGVFGAGGLGMYAVQYAKLLSSGASVVAFARSDEKLQIAREHGADYVLNTRGKSIADIRLELKQLTGQSELDAAIDCVGAEETLQIGFGLLTTAGAYVSVGLVGNRINIPLFPFVAREYSYFGSFWGNYTDMVEVMRLAQAGLIKHSIERIQPADINEYLERLRDGDVIGRAVIMFGQDGQRREIESARVAVPA